MTHYQLLFPGQGSQYVGMGQSVLNTPEGAKLLKIAQESLGFDLGKIMLSGSEAELTQTAVAQPAILLHSVAVYRCVKNFNAKLVLGHSLGEYSALVVGGVLDFKDAILAVHKRGKLMQEAVPQGEGAMAAVIGFEVSKIKNILSDFQDYKKPNYVTCANFNGPAQTVIAGTKAGVSHASELLKQAGAKRVISLPVSAPFHCKLMEPVKIGMKEVLDSIKFGKPKISYISNISAQIEDDPERIKKLLLDQITGVIRFTECVELILKNKLENNIFVELGPKNILGGIVKKIDRQAKILSVDTKEDFSKILPTKLSV